MTCECGAEMMPCRVQIPGQPQWRHAYVCQKCEAPETVTTAQPLQGYQLAMPSKPYPSKFAADPAGADVETGDGWGTRDIPGAIEPPEPEGVSE